VEPGRSSRGTQPISKYVSSASWPEEGTFPGVQLQSTWVVGIVLWAVVSVCHRAIKINSLSSEVRGSNPRLMFTRATISLSISRWVWRYQRNLSGALWLFIFGLRRPVQLVLALEWFHALRTWLNADINHASNKVSVIYMGFQLSSRTKGVRILFVSASLSRDLGGEKATAKQQ